MKFEKEKDGWRLQSESKQDSEFLGQYFIPKRAAHCHAVILPFKDRCE